MEMKALARNTMILASPKIVKFLIGLLKTKFIAIFLGATGLGIIDQLSNTINRIKQLSLSMLPDGMVRIIAKQNSIDNNTVIIASIIKTYFLMVIPVAVLVTTLGYLFDDQLTLYIFGKIEYKLYFQIGMIALPVSLFSASFRSFLKAYKEIKSIAFIEILVIILNLLLFIPLVYYLDITGGVIYATGSFIVTFIVVFSVVRKNIFIKYKISYSDIKNAKFSNIHFKELLAFISSGILVGAFSVFEEVTVRSLVVNQLGIEELGIYNPITKWGSLFVGFILPSMYTYLYPRLSEAKDDDEIVGVVNDVIRLLTFVILPFIIVGISTRHWIIPLFYSKEFIGAAIYLPFHFSALLFVVWSRALEQIFAPSGRLKFLMIFVIIFKILGLILVFYAIPKVGLYGYMLRFTLMPLITIIAYFIFWRGRINFRLQKENISIMMYSIFCVLILIFLRNYEIYIQSLSMLLIGPMYFLLNKKEKNFIQKKIKNIKAKF